MSAPPIDPVLRVWGEIRDWPPSLRLSLASKIIQSLQREQTPSADKEGSRPGCRQTPADLIGAWRVNRPPGDSRPPEKFLEYLRFYPLQSTD
jgi:hypothetical protein